MKRIVVTGATGMIGTALVRECVRQGVEVYALCHKGSPHIERLRDDPLVHILECDLDELQSLKTEDLPQCDVFYHLGWAGTIGDGRDDMELQLRNVQCTLSAVTLASLLGCHTFVGAGSQAEYGRYEGKLGEDTPTVPENGYGMAKLCAGQMSRVVCRQYRMRHIWARILSVYGPYDSEQTMISTVIQKLLKGEKPALTAGEQKWDYLYCDDAARALFLLGERGIDGRIYCIGSGNAQSLKSYVEILRDQIDPSAPLGLGEIAYRPQQVMYLCADISLLVRDTGWRQEVPFAEGIRRTIRCHQALLDGKSDAWEDVPW